MKHSTLGLDLAKDTFFLVELGRTGKVIERKRLSRKKLTSYIAKLEPSKIAMEACACAHYWARSFREYGHDVLLLPPQHVKGYLRGQKNDYNDAQAIAEAAQHGSIRAVEIKSIEQQDEQALHRIRQMLTTEKTSLTNQMRGLLAEYGIVIRRGDAAFRTQIPDIVADRDNGLTEAFRILLSRQHECFLTLVDELAWYTKRLQVQAKSDETCRRLCEIPGFGPIVSTAFKSQIGSGHQFKRGRDASAALGVVPRQHSTGGKPVLLGITKRGDSYLRSLLIHGARSCARRASTKTDPLSRWINALVARRGFNKAVVALANKMIRIGWVIVARGERYQAQVA